MSPLNKYLYSIIAVKHVFDISLSCHHTQTLAHYVMAIFAFVMRLPVVAIFNWVDIRICWLISKSFNKISPLAHETLN